jgi:formylglycine-generating enzyme required for sulfatase activity
MEAEWERAARGGMQTRFSFGDALECDDACGACASADTYVWWCGNSGSTSHPVGTKQANPYGLFDMHGNVLASCEDWYGAYGSSARANAGEDLVSRNPGGASLVHLPVPPLCLVEPERRQRLGPERIQADDDVMDQRRAPLRAQC